MSAEGVVKILDLGLSKNIESDEHTYHTQTA